MGRFSKVATAERDDFVEGRAAADGGQPSAEPARLRLRALFDDGPDHLSQRIAVIYALLVALNAGAWTWAGVAFHRYPILLGTALLAYSFGLRHAVDADHIAAIDNVTRKMMQEGRRPVAVGLMFSLGHSTVVVLGSAAVAGAALALQRHLPGLRDSAAVIGTLVSAVFLFGIAAVNLAVLKSIYQNFMRVRSGQPHTDEEFDILMSGRGFLSRLFRPMFRVIRRSWHMYPLGFLFGLGFDTATEIGLLGISAAEVARGVSFREILVLPLLFAAGMSLIDTTDNILMLGAYGWAFVKPVRKLYYNLTITGVSVLVALVIGVEEILGLLAGHLQLKGWFWGELLRLSNHADILGYLIVAVFAASWMASFAFYKWRGLDDIDLEG